MKISTEGEKYADTMFFNQSRLIHDEDKQALLKHKFVSFEDTAQKDYSVKLEAATKMAAARIDSYVLAYDAENEDIGHDDVIEFIQKAKDIIDRQSKMIGTLSGGTITMVRNQWSAEYREQMLSLFREKAFIDLEPKINELILRSKETGLKKSLRKKMSKRNDLFQWISNQCEKRQYTMADIRKFAEANDDWTIPELESASDFLAGEGLIEQKDDSGLLVGLTHKGVRAEGFEDGVIDGQSRVPTIQNTQNIFNAPIGAFQQGHHNTANVAQKIGFDANEVAGLLQQLRDHVNPDELALGNEYIDALEEEIAKETPKESRIKMCIKGVVGYVNEAGKAIVGELAKKVLNGEISL